MQTGCSRHLRKNLKRGGMQTEFWFVQCDQQRQFVLRLQEQGGQGYEAKRSVRKLVRAELIRTVLCVQFRRICSLLSSLGSSTKLSKSGTIWRTVAVMRRYAVGYCSRNR